MKNTHTHYANGGDSEREIRKWFADFLVGIH
jgi:hypothetical protein